MENPAIKGQDTDLPRCHLCVVLIQVVDADGLLKMRCLA